MQQGLEAAYAHTVSETKKETKKKEKLKLLSWMFAIESAIWPGMEHNDTTTYPSPHPIFVWNNSFVADKDAIFTTEGSATEEATKETANILIREAKFDAEGDIATNVTQFLNRLGTCVRVLLSAMEKSQYPSPIEYKAHTVKWNCKKCKQMLEYYTKHVKPHIVPNTGSADYQLASPDVMRSIIVDLWIECHHKAYRAYAETRKAIAAATG